MFVQIEIREDSKETDSDNDESQKEVLDLNKTISESKIDKITETDQTNSRSEASKNISEGMRWHLRLGHTSLEYLKHMQKYEEKLKKIKFTRDILDCEICAF